MYPDDYKWHFDYVRLAWDTGFSFDKYKYPNLDKNKICLVDIERIIKERDVASVERFVPTVVQYVLENDQAELLDTNFVKMFRISQLSVEYLLFCKKYLDHTVVLLKKEISKLKEENKELKLFTEELEGHISTLTKESFVSAFKCDKCPKVFSTQDYLHSHFKRRHGNENKTFTTAETDQLQSEIKQLKERLNNTEKLLQEKEENAQNIKFDVIEDENKLRVNEVLEKFENFKDKVENDLKMLQIEKNFYEQKYSQLFDVVLESTKKESTNTDRQSEPVNKVPEERSPDRITVDTIETTTQTEKESTPVKELQIETVHDKNVIVVKDVDVESDNAQERNNVQETLSQKISQFEEQIETKISSSLGNIEKQMQAFWGKLSEIDLKKDTKTEEIEDSSSPVQEIVEVRPPKPKIKPRMKLSKPSQLVSDNEEIVNKIRTEIEKMHVKPDSPRIIVKTVPESNKVEVPDVMYDSTSESEKKSDPERKIESESSDKIVVLPKKSKKKRTSRAKRRRRSVASLKKSVDDKESTEKLREDINNKVNRKLQDIGISPNWKGIPQKTFEKALEIVRHQANLSKKLYPDYDSVKSSIETYLHSDKDALQKNKSRLNFSPKKQTNVINISYRRKSKEMEAENKSETETKSIVTIKNRSLYNTDSDSDDLPPPKPLTKVVEAVPSYSAVIRELKTYRQKVVDTDSDVNSIVLPRDDVTNEPQAKSALKSYPSLGSLKKKKVLFDVENDGLEVERLDGDQERGSMTSIDSSDVVEEVESKERRKKNGSSLSDFDLSEL